MSYTGQNKIRIKLYFYVFLSVIATGMPAYAVDYIACREMLRTKNEFIEISNQYETMKIETRFIYETKKDKNDWLKCLQAYGLTELTVKEFKDIPINNCVKLAKAKIPLITVCGDVDTVVPIDENTYKLAAVYKAAGGEIELIIKKGVGHHPHSLKDPIPIVDFILKNTMN